MQNGECGMQNPGQTQGMECRYRLSWILHSAFADLRGALCSNGSATVVPRYCHGIATVLVRGRSGGGPMNEEG